MHEAKYSKNEDLMVSSVWQRLQSSKKQYKVAPPDTNESAACTRVRAHNTERVKLIRHLLITWCFLASYMPCILKRSALRVCQSVFIKSISRVFYNLRVNPFIASDGKLVINGSTRKLQKTLFFPMKYKNKINAKCLFHILPTQEHLQHLQLQLSCMF